MSRINLEIPDESLLALKVPLKDAAEELRLAAAVKLYELSRLSAGAAARLAGLSEPQFLLRLADYGVPALDLTREELDQERAID